MPQDKLENTLLARVPTVPFKDGLRPLVRTMDTAKQLEELKKFSPTSHLVQQEGVDIFEGGLYNTLLNRMLSPLDESATSMGGHGAVSIAPKHIGNDYVLLHELGHERQRQLNKPIVNNTEADYLFHEAVDNKNRIDAFFDPDTPLRRGEPKRKPKFGMNRPSFNSAGELPEWYDYMVSKMAGEKDPDRHLRSLSQYKPLYTKSSK